VILINLLPYREARRRERKRQFFVALAGSVAVGVGIVAAWFTVLQEASAEQEVRNEFLRQQVAMLDGRIKDIATLRAEIEELNSRRREVEGLQTNRNQPVLLLGELVRHTPDGVHLTSMRQVADVITLNGVAQSNERVSELLRNLGRNATWLESPELLEIQAAVPAATEAGAATPSAAAPTRQFQFSLRVKIRRPGQGPVPAAAAVRPA
jgi:type IV pilus assembly protein PilN